jgi:hypothetical protein
MEVRGFIASFIQFTPIAVYMDFHGIPMGSKEYWIMAAILVISSAIAESIREWNNA